MTMRNQSRSCDEFQQAAMVRLDGEPAPLIDEEIDAHIVHCDACRAALAGFTSLAGAINRVNYDQPGVDLWPNIRDVVSPAPEAPRDTTAIVGLALALGVWRLAQLLVDLPAPVVNSTVPLALMVVVLWRFVGDPFAIQVSSQRFHRGRS